MAARSIASLTLSFGLVAIPVRLFSATESAASVRFNLLDKDGSRVKQQYVSEKDGRVVPRAEMVKGYEFEKDRFVLFAPDELKALEEASSHVVEIIAFIPAQAVDPIYYDKAYFLAPDKRGGKPYALLAEAMRKSHRCALAKWQWKAKQYVVQIRPAEDGLVLQQLLYADEVRSLKDLDIEKVDVSQAELQLALQLIEQISEDAYDATQYEDEEKKRVLAAIDEKISGKQIVATAEREQSSGAQVIDLVEALKASLRGVVHQARRQGAAGQRDADGRDQGAQVREAGGQARRNRGPDPRARKKVTKPGVESAYTLRRVQEMLGISRAVVTGLVGAGFVSPTRGVRNEYRFTFQDLMLLRTAYGLQQAQIPPRKILSSLRKLRATLPAELPLTGIRVTAVGADVAVRDRQGSWAADTGQLLMDFEVAPVDGSVAFFQPSPATTSTSGDPAAWLARGAELEATDPAQAEAAYREALRVAPDYVDAYLNLGALLCEQARCKEAVSLYDDAMKRCPPTALLFFNHAVAQEDAGDLQAALRSYEHCLRMEPQLADAHYNLGILQERLGDAHGALRHFNTYRRLTR
jgi:DNA end-binding protein Ku